MKNKINLLTVIVLFFASSFAFSEVIEVDTSGLTQEQRDQIFKISELSQDSGSIQGIGKEIGIAFSEVWSVVSSDVESFANSPAGLWAAILVTWKVMGEDATNLLFRFVRVVVGVGLFLVANVAWFVVLFKLFSTQKIYDYKLDEKTGKSSKYLKEVKRSLASEDWGIAGGSMSLAYLLAAGISALIAFA